MNIERIVSLAVALGHGNIVVDISRTDCGDAGHQWYVAVRNPGNNQLIDSAHGVSVADAAERLEKVIDLIVTQRVEEAERKARELRRVLEGGAR